jgi:hypothetical protein
MTSLTHLTVSAAQTYMNFGYGHQSFYFIILQPVIRNMRKQSVIIIILCLSFVSTSAQFDTVWIKNNIRKCADSMAHGFTTKNWEMYARYSYPAIIGSMGGKEQFKKIISETFAQIPDSAWKLYEPGKVLQVIKTEGDMQAVIELKSVLAWDNSLITTVSHLIGESWNGGLFWTFFGNDGDTEAAKLIKPDLSPLIIIPKRKDTTGPVAPAKQRKN